MFRVIQPNYYEINNKEIDPKIVLQNKLFHGDIVNDDFSLKHSLREEFKIGGVLKLKNIYTFGCNKKGQELFEFIPITWRYPKFLVASNIKKNMLKRKETVTDCFAVIKFKDWTSKLPHGTIERNIGTIDDIENQYEVLLNYYPILPIKQDFSKMILTDENSLRKPLEIDVYSIDPEGCQDIDDAISYDLVNNRIGIHITDTTIIQSEFEPKLFSTVYAPHTHVHMFPPEIATQACSLKEGEIRQVITCWINCEGNSVPVFETNSIIVKKNLSYEEADKIKTKCAVLKKLFDFSISLGEKLGINVKDTHNMVEVYMIMYNKAMAEYLEKPIYRTQKLNEVALYSWIQNEHVSLNLYKYTHATSPIRRYVDHLIQRMFKKLILYCSENILDKINEYNTNIKKLYRMWDYLKASTEMISGNIYQLEFVKVESERLQFFCKELNITISNKINYVHVEQNILLINGRTYTLGETYSLQLYLIEDTKNVPFFKILIQF
jgi:exoribonuclease R